jgi:hypothetical protein
MPFVYFYAENKFYAENIHKFFRARDSSPPHSLSTAPSMGDMALARLRLGEVATALRYSIYLSHQPTQSLYLLYPPNLFNSRAGWNDGYIAHNGHYRNTWQVAENGFISTFPRLSWLVLHRQ